MAQLTQEEQIRFHEFSVRYREALAKQHPPLEKSFGTFTDAVRGQYEQEQEAKHSPTIGPPDPSPEPEPEEPDQDH